MAANLPVEQANPGCSHFARVGATVGAQRSHERKSDDDVAVPRPMHVPSGAVTSHAHGKTRESRVCVRDACGRDACETGFRLDAHGVRWAPSAGLPAGR